MWHSGESWTGPRGPHCGWCGRPWSRRRALPRQPGRRVQPPSCCSGCCTATHSTDRRCRRRPRRWLRPSSSRRCTRSRPNRCARPPPSSRGRHWRTTLLRTSPLRCTCRSPALLHAAAYVLRMLYSPRHQLFTELTSDVAGCAHSTPAAAHRAGDVACRRTCGHKHHHGECVAHLCGRSASAVDLPCRAAGAVAYRQPCSPG